MKERLFLLEKEIDLLLRAHEEYRKRIFILERKNNALKEELKKLISDNSHLREKKELLETFIAVSGNENPENKKFMKKKINSLIERVNRCIDFLKEY